MESHLHCAEKESEERYEVKVKVMQERKKKEVGDRRFVCQVS